MCHHLRHRLGRLGTATRALDLLNFNNLTLILKRLAELVLLLRKLVTELGDGIVLLLLCRFVRRFQFFHLILERVVRICKGRVALLQRGDLALEIINLTLKSLGLSFVVAIEIVNLGRLLLGFRALGLFFGQSGFVLQHGGLLLVNLLVGLFELLLQLFAFLFDVLLVIFSIVFCGDEIFLERSNGLVELGNLFVFLFQGLGLLLKSLLIRGGIRSPLGEVCDFFLGGGVVFFGLGDGGGVLGSFGFGGGNLIGFGRGTRRMGDKIGWGGEVMWACVGKGLLGQNIWLTNTPLRVRKWNNWGCRPASIARASRQTSRQTEK